MGDTPQGHGCVVCGRTWLSILDRKAEWAAGVDGIAHVGKLNAGEVMELHGYEARRNDWIWRVTMGREAVEDEPEDIAVTW
jgi:uncharacterized protein YunC (DUF1805 family)